MWSIDDVAAQLVFAFYGDMFDGSGRFDWGYAAVASHKAVKKIHKEIPLEQLIVFIHIGA